MPDEAAGAEAVAEPSGDVAAEGGAECGGASETEGGGDADDTAVDDTAVDDGIDGTAVDDADDGADDTAKDTADEEDGDAESSGSADEAGEPAESEADGEAAEEPRVEVEDVPEGAPTVLIAPSWQVDSILDTCIDELITGLVGHGWRIIVRPHPEYTKRYRARWEGLQARWSHAPENALYFEQDFSSSRTVWTSDVLITDWSSIAGEFSFSTLKPSIFIDTPMKVHNPDWEELGIEPTDISLRNQIGVSVSPDDLGGIGDVVQQMLDGGESWSGRIEEVRDGFLYNLGHAAEASGEYILKAVMRAQKARKKALEKAAGADGAEGGEKRSEDADSADGGKDEKEPKEGKKAKKGKKGKKKAKKGKKSKKFAKSDKAAMAQAAADEVDGPDALAQGASPEADGLVDGEPRPDGASAKDEPEEQVVLGQGEPEGGEAAGYEADPAFDESPADGAPRSDEGEGEEPEGDSPVDVGQAATGTAAEEAESAGEAESTGETPSDSAGPEGDAAGPEALEPAEGEGPGGFGPDHAADRSKSTGEELLDALFAARAKELAQKEGQAGTDHPGKVSDSGAVILTASGAAAAFALRKALSRRPSRKSGAHARRKSK